VHDGALVGGRFIDTGNAMLAAVIWTPPPGIPARFAVLHVPAAFEEMNKARRMVALQARAFASMGGCVVVYDPVGTGDSSGDPADATFARWRSDALTMWSFMCGEFPVPAVLWGLRLGALMAASLAGDAALSASALVLWQPVASGRTFFNQFLRLAAAAEIAGRPGTSPAAGSVRQQLEAGAVVEVAGYAVHPDLVTGASALSLESIAPPPCAVVWRESTAAAPAEVSPVAMKTAQRWSDGGARVDLRPVTGPSFWATAEIEESPALIAATSEAVARDLAPAHAAAP
jgi:exosortase A-associated hydrolase 2